MRITHEMKMKKLSEFRQRQEEQEMHEVKARLYADVNRLQQVKYAAKCPAAKRIEDSKMRQADEKHRELLEKL